MSYTLRDVSTRTGLSVPFLSQIENGAATPSLASLFSVARTLDTTPESLLAGPSNEAVRMVRSDGGTRFRVTDSDTKAVRRQITGETESFSAAEYVVEPGADLGGFLASQGRELLYVITGRFAVDLRENDAVTVHELSEGDSLLYSTSVEHRWRHLGRKVTRIMHVIAPIG